MKRSRHDKKMHLFDSRNSAMLKLRMAQNVWTLSNEFVTVEENITFIALNNCSDLASRYFWASL